MSKKLKRVILNLENCDSIYLDASDIEELHLKNITSEVVHFSSTDCYNLVNYFVLVLKDTIKSKQIYFPCFSNKDNFESIKEQCNIVSIILEYENESVEYNVLWPPEDDFYNSYEKVETCKDHLIISIFDRSIKAHNHEYNLTKSDYVEECYYEQLNILDV